MSPASAGVNDTVAGLLSRWVPANLQPPVVDDRLLYVCRGMVEHGSERAYLGWMFFSNIDHWIGKTLFVPPIIKLCQLTRQSQFAVSRLFWFIAALDGFYRADTLFSSILWGGMSVLMMFTASQRADHPTVSFMFFRLLAVVFLALDLLKGATTGEWAGSEFWIFVLIAEYAATIRTVPPRESAEVAAKAASGG